MTAMTESWIMYAGMAVWAVICLYAAFLSARQRALSKKISLLEELGNDKTM